MADGILKAKCCYYCKIILVAIEINLLLSVILMFDLFLTASVKTQSYKSLMTREKSILK